MQPWFPGLEIVELLGAGGMGAVYKARQPRLNRFVALKILTCPPEHYADFAMRFEREAQVMARLNHPHIVTIFDFGEVDRSAAGMETLFYFLMEFVDGTDLNQLIRTGELKPEEAIEFVPQICEALQFAHDEGITHRDIKPANILVDRKSHVKIADFGLAKLIQGDETLAMGLTMTGTAMGTPQYMAPEQWESPEKVDHRADIYALGVVIYELLTGERPAGVFDPPSKKCGSDKRIDTIVMRAMEKEPDRRYQQAQEINSEVTRLIASAPGLPSMRRRRQNRIGMVAGLVAMLGMGGWFYRAADDRQEGSPPTTIAPSPVASEGSDARSARDWVTVDFASAAPAMNDPRMELRAGRLHMEEWADWSPLPSRSFHQVAQRVSFTWSEALGQTTMIELKFHHSAPSGKWYEYYARLGKADVEGQYWSIGRIDQDNTVNFTGVGRMIAPPLMPGDSAVFQFAIIGETFYAWLNGRLLRAVRPQDNILNRNGELNLKANYLVVDRYEYLALDGLSEEEARKVLGVEDVVPTIGPVPDSEADSRSAADKPETELDVASAQPSSKPGHLRATGTFMNGQPLDLSKCTVYDDFVDVVAGSDYWIGLRSNGQLISSDGRADLKDIRRIARSYGGFPCFIDVAGKIRFHRWMEMKLPAVLDDAVVLDAACGEEHGVALLESGEAVVFGRRYEEAVGDPSVPSGTRTPRWQQPPASALKNVKEVAAILTHAAALHLDGSVSVWGWNGPVTWEPEAKMKAILQIASAQDAFRMLDTDGQVWEFPLPRNVHPDQPVGFNGKVLQLGTQAVRLRDQFWLRQDGTWRGNSADRLTIDMLQAGNLNADANFSLKAGGSPPATFGYLLWIESVEAEATSSKLPAATKDVSFENSLGMKFVPVPGTEVMFCIHETRWRDYEVYAEEVDGVAPDWRNQIYNDFTITDVPAEHPVVYVNWEDAKAFCAWLSKKEGKIYRLPTDHEWSMAVGIGSTEIWNRDTTPATVNKSQDAFPWGNEWPPPQGAGNYSDESLRAKAPSKYAQYVEGGYDDGFPTTAPVMSFEPKALGIFDLGGNVWEWCEDWFSDEQKERVLRGGSWDFYDRRLLLSSNRGHKTPDTRINYCGFRVVVENTGNSVVPAAASEADTNPPTSPSSAN
ncbi:MAG: SUMF1/EgtB/PvdO family nonheme iron enzyme [Verrucomicrobiales bacterium]|nr:SUMF1/EgtB/PvdO family nonheme iron enzyme [Verrucomicrobiales bacterium]